MKSGQGRLCQGSRSRDWSPGQHATLQAYGSSPTRPLTAAGNTRTGRPGRTTVDLRPGTGVTAEHDPAQFGSGAEAATATSLSRGSLPPQTVAMLRQRRVHDDCLGLITVAACGSGKREQHGVAMHRLQAVSALAIGSLPTFLLPVVVVSTMGAGESALFLLALNVAIVVAGIFYGSLESILLARFGAHHTRGKPIGTGPMLTIVRQSAFRGGIPASLIFVLLVTTLGYFAGLAPGIGPAVMVMLMALSSVAMCAGAPYAAEVFSRGALPQVYVSGVFRGGPSLVGAVAGCDVVLLSALYLLGECCRTLFLFACSARANRNSDPVAGVDHVAFPSTKELGAQYTTFTLAQAVPLVSQFIFAAGGAASIAQGAVALRVYAAANQVVTSGITMHNIVRIPRLLIETAPPQRTRALRREWARVAIAAAGASALIAVLLLVATTALHGKLPQEVTTGVQWSFVLLASVPLQAAATWGARALLAVGMGRFLPVLSLASALLGIGASLVLLTLLGAAAGLAGYVAMSLVAAVANVLALARWSNRKRGEGS